MSSRRVLEHSCSQALRHGVHAACARTFGALPHDCSWGVLRYRSLTNSHRYVREGVVSRFAECRIVACA